MAKSVRSARKSSWKFSHALVMFFIVAIMSLGMSQVHLAGALRVDVSVRQDSVMKAALANVARGY